MLMRFIVPCAGVLGALAMTTPAAADDVVFGSALSDSANAMPYRNGWDQTVFNTAGPVGIAAPMPGLVKQVRLRGFA
ncbi:MAG: hypothetical protein ACJ76G_05440, partial [Solirubrobacterales bacterium]